MKKGITLVLLVLLPIVCFAQGHKGKAEQCAPMIEGKVCYTDDIKMKGASQTGLYEAISKWANEEYGKDYLISNVSCNRAKKTILVSSRVELLLNETEKTILRFKMYISCFDENYKVEVKNLTFQYDPDNGKRMRSYAAESILADNGKGNTVPSIKDPELFCNATFFFVENLLDDVYLAAKEHE